MIRGIIIRIRKKTSRRKIKGAEEVEDLEEGEAELVEMPKSDDTTEVVAEVKETDSKKPGKHKNEKPGNVDTMKAEQSLKNDEEPDAIEDTVFVLPGALIGTNEEFTAGSETFVRGGDIFSLVTGTVRVDNKRRIISVVPIITTPPVIKEGDIVVGEIFNVRDSMVLLRIGGIKGEGERAFQAPVAAIHVSNVKNAYVKDISKEFGIFDIIKAKVINLENTRLSTSDDELGVMRSLCPVCRTPMVRDAGKDKLKCPSCGNIQSRKIASGFGTGII